MFDEYITLGLQQQSIFLSDNGWFLCFHPLFIVLNIATDIKSFFISLLQIHMLCIYHLILDEKKLG